MKHSFLPFWDTNSLFIFVDPDVPVARTFRPLHWYDQDRIYGRGQGSSNIVYYSFGSQEVVEIFRISEESDPGSWPIDITSLGANKVVYSSGEEAFIFDLSTQEVEKRLLKGCNSQKPIRLSAYDQTHLYLEATLVNSDNIQRTRVFRKDINKNSKEALQIF